MAFVTEKYCVDSLKRLKLKYWRLYDADGALLGEQQDAGVDLDESVEQLQVALSEITGGSVIVRANGKKSNEIARGGAISKTNYEFKIQIGRVQQSGRGQSSDFGMMERYFDLKMEFERYKFEQQLNEIKAAKKEKVDPFASIIGDVRDYLKSEYVESKLKGGNKTAIAGTEADHRPEQETAEKAPQNAKGATNKEMITEALTTLAGIDGEIGANLLALAKFAKENPDQYKLYLQALKNSSNG